MGGGGCSGIYRQLVFDIYFIFVDYIFLYTYKSSVRYNVVLADYTMERAQRSGYEMTTCVIHRPTV